MEHIHIKGAREHNLKNLDVTLPKNHLVVITGLSGSGKSSLAFDTLYAEGQRRYVESLSAYARQFLDLMEKPDVDAIEGLSPAISIEQKTTSHNPRSTVGTVTEIYDYLRVLFARMGKPYCPSCGRPIESQTVQQMVDASPGPARGREGLHPRPRGAGPEGRVPEALPGPPPGGVRARPGGRQGPGAGGQRRPGPLQGPLHRSRGGPPRHQGRRAEPPHRVRGAGPPEGRGAHDRPPPGQRRGPALLRAPLLPHLPDGPPRDGTPPLLLQQPARRLPRLLGARGQDGAGPGQDRPQPVPLHRPGGPGALARGGRILVPGDARGPGTRAGFLPEDAVGKAVRRGEARGPLRDQRQQDRLRREAGHEPVPVRARLRGGHPQPPPAVQGDQVGRVPGGDRVLHVQQPLPRLRGPAAEARGPLGEGGRVHHRRLHGPPRGTGRRRPWRASASPRGTGRSRG